MMGENARVAIIGGTGRMGSWLARVLARRGHPVLKAGRRTRTRPEHAARSCDVVVISVPLERTIKVIERNRALGPGRRPAHGSHVPKRRSHGTHAISLPGQLGWVDPHNDHRIAMSLAVAGLRIPGIRLQKPHPGFWELWNLL